MSGFDDDAADRVMVRLSSRARRERIAMCALQGLLAGDVVATSFGEKKLTGREAANFAVQYADALIAKLDEPDGR